MYNKAMQYFSNTNYISNSHDILISTLIKYEGNNFPFVLACLTKPDLAFVLTNYFICPQMIGLKPLRGEETATRFLPLEVSLKLKGKAVALSQRGEEGK